MLNSNEFNFSPKVVGYWFNEKKSQKFGANELAEACRKINLKFIKINLEEDLDGSQKYDVFLHKLTALYAPSFSGDLKAQMFIRKIEHFAKENPHILIMDPLESVQKLLLRIDTYLMLSTITSLEENIFTPKFVALTKENVQENLDTLLEKNEISFPVVCKPLLAGGGKDAHEMELVFNKNHLQSCTFPCVAQSFINHDAVLYKIFVIGAKWFATIRPSLKNFNAGDMETIVFNSHQISKPDSDSPLTHLDNQYKRIPKASLLVLERIVRLVRKALESDLIGIDVVIDNKNHRHAVIDVNPFPSYESVPDVMDHIADAIRERIDSSTRASGLKANYYKSINVEQKFFINDLSGIISDEERKSTSS